MVSDLTPSDCDRYRELISNQRFDPSSVGAGRSLPEEAASDRSRILYSSAFRRLQQKTQVFPLSKNAAVRSRLTHSLEVADVGRLIARSLTRGFLKPLDDEIKEALILLCETGCLMHDIGNPPFGHFAEVTVQRWFGNNWLHLYNKSRGKQAPEPSSSSMGTLVNDFLKFDGNPQGLRMVTRLQGRTTEERKNHGMNLTFSQILTGLKYLSAPSDPEDGEQTKKPGFFESERDRIKRAREGLGISETRRFPLTYIVEVADDISYCLSDMEDGIDRGVLSARAFFEAVHETLKKIDNPEWKTLLEITERERKTSAANKDRDDFFEFKTYFTPALIRCAAVRYRERHELILKGELTSLFETGDDERTLLDALRKIAARDLYSSSDVEQPLRVGLQVVNGILDHYGEVLKLSKSDFEELIEARTTGDLKKVRGKKDPELLLFDRLPSSYREIYDFEKARDRRGLPNAIRAVTDSDWEWFCRAHLLLDYLSGMTDDFALRTYHELAGIGYEL